jgi:hypothetical protein
MKWSELDEQLIVKAACLAVDQRVVNVYFFHRQLKVTLEVASRLFNQLVELKIISNNRNDGRVFFFNRHSVQTYLDILRELGEFTQADIDRFDFMRTIQHWKNYDHEAQFYANDEENPIAKLDAFYQNKHESLKQMHPQLMFKRSVFQRVLYSTWLVGAIGVGGALTLVVFMIEWRVESLRAEDLHANPLVQIGLLIVSSVFWQLAWKEHLRSPIELYWVGNHFEAVFPDGTLDRKPDLSKVLYYQKDGKTREGGWLSLSPTSKYFGANWEGLKDCHQAWMNAQKEE